MSDIAFRVRTMIAAELRVDVARVTDAARLGSDLAADHIDVVDLVMELEDRFEVTVTDDEMEAIATVADVIALAQRTAVARAA